MDPYSFSDGRVLRIVLEINIAERPAIRLVRNDPGDSFRAMPSTIASVAAQGAASPLPVAGRIVAAGDTFDALLAAWVRRLKTFGHSAKTIAAYRENARAFARHNGWAAPADITTETIEGYIAHKREAGEWNKGTTVNRELYAVRSLCKFLVSRKLLREDPSLEVMRAKDDGDEGARAASRDEAIGVLTVAFAREKVLGYKKSARWLQHLLMFQAGLRVGECGKLEWRKHLHLDAAVPHIFWSRDINKNGRRMQVALHPELVTLLREHRENMRALAATMKEVLVRNKRRHNEGAAKVRRVSPDEPGSFVFPWVSSAFEADAARAGIAVMDERERTFSPHSARKFFETELEAAGVSKKMSCFLMRHKGGTDMRYFDPPLKRQLLRLSKLPALSPEVIHNLPRLKDSSLTPRRDDGHDGATCQNARPHQPTQANPRPSRTEHSGEFKASMAAGLIEFLQRGLAGEPGAAFESKDISKPAMPIAPFETDSDSDALADLLTALAVLLRKGQARGSSERIQRQGRSERAG
jgi:site-specific recombinase XerD